MENLKAGIFDGPQIRELIKDDVLNPAELSAWISLNSVIVNFLGCHRNSQYQKVVDELNGKFLPNWCEHVSKNSLPPVLSGLFSRELWRLQ